MGYTHYWEAKPIPKDDWAKLVTKARALCEVAKSQGVDFDPDFSDAGSYFTISGGCETFVVGRLLTGFQFCKTRQDSYDCLVVAILITIADMGLFTWSSDGDGSQQDEFGIAKKLLAIYDSVHAEKAK